MSIKNNLLFSLMPLVALSCGQVKNTKYQDTSHLETPPILQITAKPKTKKTKVKEQKAKGLGDVVFLVGTTEKPVIKIKKLFDRSWNIVAQALQFGNIEITDKNRDKGVFYVLFDPDEKKSEDESFVDSLSFFMFKDEFEKAAYKLTVVWQESTTEVSVDLVNEDTLSLLLKDDEDMQDGSIDSGAKLIQSLFETIRDDLPLS